MTPESKYFFAITFPKINVVVSFPGHKNISDVIPDKHLPKWRLLNLYFWQVFQLKKKKAAANYSKEGNFCFLTEFYMNVRGEEKF